MEESPLRQDLIDDLEAQIDKLILIGQFSEIVYNILKEYNIRITLHPKASGSCVFELKKYNLDKRELINKIVEALANYPGKDQLIIDWQYIDKDKPPRYFYVDWNRDQDLNYGKRGINL